MTRQYKFILIGQNNICVASRRLCQNRINFHVGCLLHVELCRILSRIEKSIDDSL